MPRVHRVASLLKRWLLGTHQGAVSEKHLDYYLDEFTFRFNRRRSRARGLLFYRCFRTPYKSIRCRTVGSWEGVRGPTPTCSVWSKQVDTPCRNKRKSGPAVTIGRVGLAGGWDA